MTSLVGSDGAALVASLSQSDGPGAKLDESEIRLKITFTNKSFVAMDLSGNVRSEKETYHLSVAHRKKIPSLLVATLPPDLVWRRNRDETGD